MESLGKTLKSLREEKGMTLMDISKATKIRTSVLSSLENEEWDKLPQRIFIKGFVRAYAHAVGADENLILDLFESSCPIEDQKITCPTFESQPMDSLDRGKRKRSYKWVFILILILLICGGLYFLFQKYYNQLVEFSQPPVKEETTIVVPPKPEQKAPVTPGAENTPPKTQPPSNTEDAAATGTTPSVANTMGEASQTTVKPEEKPKPQEVPAVTPPAREQPAKQEKTETATKPGPAEKTSEKTSNDNLLITAKMETWIGLKIDGKTRKEILLKPGKTFSTKVDKFVELLIGNAGGIDITFNGKKVENIGKPGQVVRLRLPRKKTPEE